MKKREKRQRKQRSLNALSAQIEKAKTSMGKVKGGSSPIIMSASMVHPDVGVSSK